MKTYNFDKVNKTITVHKDCQKCVHINVCAFHKNMDEFSRKNVMYNMTQYAEHNDILRVFEYHASCKHFIAKYKSLIGESPTLESDIEIIDAIVSYDVKSIQENLLLTKFPEHKDNVYFFFNPEIKKDIKSGTYSLILKTTNKDIGHGTIVFQAEKNISELLKEWKFSD